MLEFRACLPEHVRALRVQPEQRDGHAFIVDNGHDASVLHGMSYSGWRGGECVAAGGVFTQWNRHGIAWLMAATEAGPEMLRLTRFTRGLFQVSPYDRISITVRCDFAAGHRWARLLGMVLECERMVQYDPAGRDCALYAWIRKT